MLHVAGDVRVAMMQETVSVRLFSTSVMHVAVEARAFLLAGIVLHLGCFTKSLPMCLGIMLSIVTFLHSNCFITLVAADILFRLWLLSWMFFVGQCYSVTWLS